MSAEVEQGLRFQIERAGAAPELLEVDAPRALLGSGAHCEVRLATQEAQLEHLLVRCTPAGLEAACCGAAAVTLPDGAPFVRGLVRDGARFVIGGCRLRVERIGERSKGRSQGRRAGAPLLAVLGLASVAALVALLLEPGGGAPVAAPPRTPPLWAAPDAESCARASSDEARELGRLHWRAALMQQERSPYHLKDARLALSSLQRARACFEQGRDAGDAARAGREFERLLRELEADYHRRRVLLERAIGQSDWHTAAREAAALQQLLGPRHADYASWLSDVERFASAWATPEEG